MEDWDNPAYPFRVFELPGGVRVRRKQVESGSMLVVFEAARREVSCPMQPADAQHLPDGHLLPYPGTWFWYVHCEWTPQPYGPYLSREEAEAGARARLSL